MTLSSSLLKRDYKEMLMKKITIKDLNIAEKSLFIRVDYNVPIGPDGKVSDDLRIIASLDTIKYALQNNCKLILASHLGRPKGNRIPSMSLKPVAAHLSNLLQKEVKFIDDCIGDIVSSAVKELKAGEILLLENLRFYNEETKNDDAFAKKLASLAEIYINDAFGAIHRAHASVHAIAQYFGAKAIGLLMEKELHYLSEIIEGARHPFLAVLGGAKVSDKISVIEALIQKIDGLIIGGAMAFTFLKAAGYDVGTSLIEEDKIEVAQAIMEKIGATNCKLFLPRDFLTVENISENEEIKITKVGKKFDNRKGVDIGPESIELFKSILKDASLIFWNGPMGIFEMDKFSIGTIEIAKAISSSSAITVAGGGDTIAAIRKADLINGFTHISTGGGASLEFIAGEQLPGLSVIPEK